MSDKRDIKNELPLDDIEIAIRGMGDLALQRAREINGYIVYMKDKDVVYEFVNGKIIKVEDMKRLRKQFVKDNYPFSKIEEYKERKEELTKKEIDHLFALIGSLQGVIVSDRVPFELKEDDIDFAEAERRAESPEEEWIEFDENKTSEEYVEELLQLHKEGKLKLKTGRELLQELREENDKDRG